MSCTVKGSRMCAHPCGFMCAHKCLCVYLVEPGDDRVLSVIRQLLDVSVTVRGFRRGVSVDAGHHPLHTHHLHSIRHHQCVNEGQVGTLQRHTTASSGLPWTPPPLSKSIKQTDYLVMLAPLCVSARHFDRVKSTPLDPLVPHWKPSVHTMFLRFRISSSLPW